MTIDEAIKHCEEVAGHCYECVEGGCSECEKEHRQLAEWLKELKAYKEQSGDAISRQAVFKQIGGWIISGEYGFTNATEYLSKRIKALPSVTPQQSTGRWLVQPSNKEQGERDFIWWKCSECGQVIFSETEKDRREYHAYCGRCGAKMEVKE